MKFKILLGLIFLIVCGVVVTNMVYGNMIAEELETELRLKIEENNVPLDIIFSEISVNPLFMSVEIKEVVVIDNYEKFKIECDNIALDISYEDALRLSGTKNIEEINSFKISFENINFNEIITKKELNCDNLSMNFDGHLLLNKFDSILTMFPTEKQMIEISIQNISGDLLMEYSDFKLSSEQQNNLLMFEEIHLVLNYLPETKEINFKNLSIYTSIASINAFGKFKYTGDGIADFKQVQLEFSTDLNLELGGEKWGNADIEGRFGFEEFNSKFNGIVNFDAKGIPELSIGESKVSLKGFTAEFSGKRKQELEQLGLSTSLGLDLDNVRLDKFSFFVKKENDKFSIIDTELIMPIINAELNCVFNTNGGNLLSTTFEKGRLVITKVSPELQISIDNFEKSMQQTLPREGDKIVLEFKGSLLNPKVKGFNFR